MQHVTPISHQQYVDFRIHLIDLLSRAGDYQAKEIHTDATSTTCQSPISQVMLVRFKLIAAHGYGAQEVPNTEHGELMQRGYSSERRETGAIVRPVSTEMVA